MDAARKLVSAACPIGDVVGLRQGFGALLAMIAFLGMGVGGMGWLTNR